MSDIVVTYHGRGVISCSKPGGTVKTIELALQALGALHSMSPEMQTHARRVRPTIERELAKCVLRAVMECAISESDTE